MSDAAARANWFFAFPVDGGFLTRVPSPPEGVRRLHPEDLHCTVAFLGPCGEARARAALDALDAALLRCRPAVIGVSLGAVVPMGNARAYSALSALLVEGRAEVEATMGSLRDALCDAAERPRELRPPKAHVTIARPSRRADEAVRSAGLAWARGLDLREVRTRIDRVALYSWSHERRDRMFRVVDERALSPARPG